MDITGFIRQIPGPVFIWVFMAFSALCIVLAKALTDADGSSSGAPVDESGIDAVAVALMQGGTDSVIRSRVLSLMRRGLVSIEADGKKWEVRGSGAQNRLELTALDAEILAYLAAAGRTPEGLFRDTEFRERVEAHLLDGRAMLERRRLLKDEEGRKKALKAALFFGCLIAAFGGLKLYLGVMRAKPVAFLVTAMLFAEAALIVVYWKRRLLTSLGRGYLKGLRARLDWTRKRKRLPEGVDPALIVALFGAGHLSVSSLYPQYTGAFGRNASSGSGCSGGCGGGGSSGDSSGGGCGGCGGCGGD